VSKRSLKKLLDGFCLVIVAPAWLLYWLGSLVAGTRRVFPGWAQFFSLLPGVIGVFLRRAFFRLTIARCEGDAWFGFGALLTDPRAEVGEYAYIGPYCVLGNVTLERDVLLGSQISVTNGMRQHGIDRLDIPIREQPGQWPRVTIGEDTWIGDRAVVMASVGKHCVIGAGAVVTEEIPDYAIAVGAPAKVVRYRKGAPAQPATEQSESAAHSSQ
jgi:acetyltransferase-like isoleucine patch superfamily enzyme